jgi:hypothetical protein
MQLASLFEISNQCGPWIVPFLAVAGLWCARATDNHSFTRWAESAFLVLLTLAATVTLRTIVINDACWLLHCVSLSLMIVGAIFPFAVSQPTETNFDQL